MGRRSRYCKKNGYIGLRKQTGGSYRGVRVHNEGKHVHHTYAEDGWHRSWNTDAAGHRSKDHITFHHNDSHVDLGPDDECDCED